MIAPDPTTVYSTFTTTCITCGSTIQFTDGKEEPHRCRIDLDAQKKS